MNDRERLIKIIEQAQRDANDTIGSMNGGSAAWYADKLIEAGVIFRKETPKSPNNTTIIANVDEMLAEYLRKRLKIVLDSIDVAPVVHGDWVRDRGADIGNWVAHRCSNCKSIFRHGYNFPDYCEKCGAKMDGGGNNEI